MDISNMLRKILCVFLRTFAGVLIIISIIAILLGILLIIGTVITYVSSFVNISYVLFNVMLCISILCIGYMAGSGLFKVLGIKFCK